jgi:hypothetical protein
MDPSVRYTLIIKVSNIYIHSERYEYEAKKMDRID